MDNLKFYNAGREVPACALKQITAGRLKGMSDINPMWRIKKLTEMFGPCGIGWWYDITDKRLEHDPLSKQTAAFVDIKLYYIDPDNGAASHGIPGTGGASFVAQERNGAYMSDECVDGDCEVLTQSGWIAFKNYNGIDKIAQFDKDTDEISFVKPTRLIHKVSSDLYDKGGVIMTAHHRNLVQRKSCNDRVTFFAEDFAKKTFVSSRNGYGRSKAFSDIKCGIYGEPKRLTPEQRIGIMIACDGALYRKNANGDIYWRLEFSKSRKTDKAKALLNEAGIDFKETTNERKNGTTTTAITFALNGSYKDYKTFLPYANYPELWDEIVSWDGCKTSGVETFCTANRENALHLQTLLALSGKTVTIAIRKRKNPKHHEMYTLYKKKHGTGSVGFKKYVGELDVYCVEVPTTFFLIRKNYEIYVTGNCYKMALTDAISVAAKALGIGADVYFARDDSKYGGDTKPVERKPPVQHDAKPKDEMMHRCEQCGNALSIYIGADGKPISLRKWASGTQQRFGKVLCDKCVAAAQGGANENK